MAKTNQNYKLADYAHLAIILTGVTFLTYIGSNIIFPIIFSFFSSLLLLPVVNWLRKIKFNHFLSCFVPVFMVFILFSGIGILLSNQGMAVVNEFSKNQNIESLKPEKMMEDVIDEVNETVGMSQNAGKKASKDMLSNIASTSSGFLFKLFSGLQETLVFLILTPIYVFFMLFYRKNLLVFISKRSSEEKRNKNLKVLNDIKKMSQQYLKGLGIVVLIVSVLNTLTLVLFGISSPIFLGIVSGLLIIIPYVGVAIGGAIPTLMALLTKDSYWIPLGVACSYGFIQFLEGNFITPNIVGDSTNLNPLVIIVGMIVLGALGGVLAMIVAVPILASVKILLENTQNFKEFSILMQNSIE